MNGEVVGQENTVLEAFASQMASFYVFNIKYPKSALDYCVLAQLAILKMPPFLDGSRVNKLTKKCITLLNNLK